MLGVPEGLDGGGKAGLDGTGKAEDCGVAVGTGPVVGLGGGVTGTAGVKVNVDGDVAGVLLGVAEGLLTGEASLAVGLGGDCCGEDEADGLAAVGLGREVGIPT